MGKLEVDIPVLPKEGARHVVVDSTGVKVYGEGEWKTRQHGVSKRRTWRKLHVGVDEATGEILAAVVSTNDIHDGTVLGDILEQIEDPIEQVSTDGAYDHQDCYNQIAKREAKPVIPPVKTRSSGSMATAKHHRIRETRISATSATMDAKSGSGILTIIAVRSQKPRCLDSKPSLVAI